MRIALLLLWWPLSLLAALPPAATPTPVAKETKLVDLGTNAFDRACLLDRGQATLANDDFRWHHAETAHFVIHYENAIFAQKVARLAEFFYDYISADLKRTNDLLPGRSHIFVFNGKKDWDTFLRTWPDRGMEWSASFVRGPEMYLQQTGSGADAADTLGHEMTHLIINRFFEGHPPLAINEGLAEWYGEFAYAAFKGIKKSRKQEFRRLAKPLPAQTILRTAQYPARAEEVQNFYLNAKYFVGFLLLRQPADTFAPFLADLMEQTDPFDALSKHYGLADVATVEKEYAKFVK